ALRMAQLSAEEERVAVLEDRDRIARDLHDVVIQRLFATGLGLQGLARYIGDKRGTERLNGFIDDLDTTTRDLPTTIFELRDAVAQEAGLRARVLAEATAAADGLSFDPYVHLRGPVD